MSHYDLLNWPPTQYLVARWIGVAIAGLLAYPYDSQGLDGEIGDYWREVMGGNATTGVGYSRDWQEAQ